jgi:hypothetical protein
MKVLLSKGSSQLCLVLCGSNNSWFVAVNKRKALHQRLGLPLDRPMLRVANALTSMNMESAVDASLGIVLSSEYVIYLTCAGSDFSVILMQSLILRHNDEPWFIDIFVCFPGIGWKRLRDVHIGLPSSGGQLCVIHWYHRGCYCAVLGDIYMIIFRNCIVLHTLTCLKDVDMSGCSPTSKQPSN